MSDRPQTIEQLQKRYEKLNNSKVRLQAERDIAAKELDRLKKKAKEQFGTDDAQQLQDQLSKLQQQNEKMKIEYQQDLDSIDQQLQNIQQASQADA